MNLIHELSVLTIVFSPPLIPHSLHLIKKKQLKK